MIKWNGKWDVSCDLKFKPELLLLYLNTYPWKRHSKDYVIKALICKAFIYIRTGSGLDSMFPAKSLLIIICPLIIYRKFRVRIYYNWEMTSVINWLKGANEICAGLYYMVKFGVTNVINVNWWIGNDIVLP